MHTINQARSPGEGPRGSCPQMYAFPTKKSNKHCFSSYYFTICIVT